MQVFVRVPQQGTVAVDLQQDSSTVVADLAAALEVRTLLCMLHAALARCSGARLRTTPPLLLLRSTRNRAFFLTTTYNHNTGAPWDPRA